MFGWLGGVIHFVLVVYTLYVLLTGKNPKNFNKLIWVIIIIVLPIVGPILFWVIEKKILG